MLVLIDHLLRGCMGNDAWPRFARERSGIRSWGVLKWYSIPLSWFSRFMIGCDSRKANRSFMQTGDVRTSSFRWGIWCFWMCNLGKVSSAFRITARMVKVAHRLYFPDELIQIHNTFHDFAIAEVCGRRDNYSSIEWYSCPRTPELCWAIIFNLDRKTNALRNKERGLVKVQ